MTELPTEPGAYVDAVGNTWLLAANGRWYVWEPGAQWRGDRRPNLPVHRKDDET